MTEAEMRAAIERILDRLASRVIEVEMERDALRIRVHLLEKMVRETEFRCPLCGLN